MTATLVRPRSDTATPIRIRPVPGGDPPVRWGPWRSTAGRPGHHEPVPVPPPAGPMRRTADGQLAARRYLDLVVEVLGGYRPVTHLRVHTEAARFDDVVATLADLGGPDLTWPVLGLVQGPGLVLVSGDRIRLRHVRSCEVRDGAVEAAAVLARDDRVRAMTLRLERVGRLWLCTHLAVL